METAISGVPAPQTTATGGGLAFTGAHVLGLVVLAIGLIFAGLSLLGLARRRHNHARP
jgi:hypothetical protein